METYPKLDIFLSGFTTLGIIVAIIMACLIWTMPSDHQKANRYLSLCLIASAITYSFYGIYYMFEEIAYAAPTLFSFGPIIEPLVIPLCYLYISQLFNPISKKPLRIWPHLIPFVLNFLCYIPLLTASHEAKLGILNSWFHEDMLKNMGEFDNPLHNLMFLGWSIYLCQLIVYLVLLFKAQHQYASMLKNVFSDIDSMKLNWVRGIILLWVLYLIFYIAGGFYPILIKHESILLYAYLGLIVQVAFFPYIAIQGFMHPYLFNTTHIRAIIDYKTETKAIKYSQSSLTSDEMNAIKTKLTTHMETHRPYLDAGLTVSELAKQIQLSRSGMLSQVLNEMMNENFYEFVNRYRVEAAKTLLLEDPDKPVIDVAYESGFKSQSTFYNYFKLLTNSNPLTYREQNQ